MTTTQPKHFNFISAVPFVKNAQDINNYVGVMISNQYLLEKSAPASEFKHDELLKTIYIQPEKIDHLYYLSYTCNNNCLFYKLIARMNLNNNDDDSNSNSNNNSNNYNTDNDDKDKKCFIYLNMSASTKSNTCLCQHYTCFNINFLNNFKAGSLFVTRDWNLLYDNVSYPYKNYIFRIPKRNEETIKCNTNEEMEWQEEKNKNVEKIKEEKWDKKGNEEEKKNKR